MAIFNQRVNYLETLLTPKKEKADSTGNRAFARSSPKPGVTLLLGTPDDYPRSRGVYKNRGFASLLVQLHGPTSCVSIKDESAH